MTDIIAATLILFLALYGAWHLTGVALGYFFSRSNGSDRKRCTEHLKGLLCTVHPRPDRFTAHREQLRKAQREAASERLHRLHDSLRRSIAFLGAQVELSLARADAKRLAHLAAHNGADLRCVDAEDEEVRREVARLTGAEGGEPPVVRIAAHNTGSLCDENRKPM